MTSVAVLGTGIMGAPIARNLARAGFAVRAWNRTRAKAEPLADEGVTVTDTPEQAVDGADVVLTMLLDGDAVEQVMEQALPGMAGAAVWLQCSTVGLAATDRLMTLARERGVPYVDAPVLGTRQPAEQGKLVVLASGDEALRERAQPLFDAIGEKTVWVGAAGTGTRLKLVVNSWVLALTTALGEAMGLAAALDLDPALFLETVRGGAVDAPYLHLKGGLMLKGEFPAAFPLAGAAKDAGLIVEAARVAGVRADVADAVRRQMERALALGHGGEDMAAVVEAVRAG